MAETMCAPAPVQPLVRRRPLWKAKPETHHSFDRLQLCRVERAESANAMCVRYGNQILCVKHAGSKKWHRNGDLEACAAWACCMRHRCCQRPLRIQYWNAQ